MSAKPKRFESDVRYGAPQYCPACKMQNVSGLSLPEECVHCKGTGKVDFGFVFTDQPFTNQTKG